MLRALSLRGRPGPRATLALAALLGLALADPASATVVRSLELSEKAQVAKAIVLARVERSEARWIVENGSIKTIVTMRVEQALKGPVKAGQTIQVAMPGGELGGITHRVAGTSAFERGERAVMFLEPHPDGWVEIGIGIGKYGIKSIDGKPMVTHDPDVTLAKAEGDGPAALLPAPHMKPVALDRFLGELRAMIGGK